MVTPAERQGGRRIPPVPAAEWPKELREAGRALTPPKGHPNAKMAPNRPKAAATMESFAHHPQLVQAFFPFNGHVLYGTTLTPRLRQILILRVAARRECAFMWAQHLFTARELAMTDEEIGRIAFGPSSPFLVPLEAAAVTAVDELIDSGVISDPTWGELASELNTQQLLDLIFTIGCYETVAFFMRSLALEVDPATADLL